MVAATTPSRQRPWPYDAYIGRQRVVLVPGDDGALVGKKTQTLDASAPITFQYDSANPFKERTFLWNKLYAGLGQQTAPTLPEVPRRYSYAQRADTSIDGYWMKGPNFESHVETIGAVAPAPSPAGEVRQLIQGLFGPTLTVFAVCENGVWRRAADGSWLPSLTTSTTPGLAGGSHPLQAVRFKGRYAGAVDALYLGTTLGQLWRFDGAAWLQASGTTTSGGPPIGPNVRHVERVGDELWAAGDFSISKVEEDPMDRSKWAGAILIGGTPPPAGQTYVGDQSSLITWLRQIDNTLYVFKEDGLYSISPQGLDQDLFPTLRGSRNVLNGRGAFVWLDQMWVPFNGRTYRLTSDGALAPDGLEQLLESGGDVQGRMVAGAGHNTWFAYELYYNGVGTSFLVKHGSWVDDGSGQSTQFLNSAHHGSLAQWGKRATTAEVLAGLHLTGNDRLYVGFADGTVEWCVLPQTGPNPAQDPNIEFTTLDSWVYLPTHHASYQADNKLWRGASTFGPRLTPSEWVEVQYRIDLANPASSWVALAPDGDPKFTVPGQRKEFPSDEPVFGREIQFRVRLMKDPSIGVSPLRFSPIIDGLAVHEQIRPSLSLEYTLRVDASSFAVRRNGTIVRQRGDELRDELLNLVAGVGTTNVMLPDGDAQEMTLVDYREDWLPRQKRRDLQYVITIQAIQLRTITQQAGSSGITYATLETYTLGELETII